jgi:flagellar biosynthesis GTPase FlhF
MTTLHRSNLDQLVLAALAIAKDYRKAGTLLMEHAAAIIFESDLHLPTDVKTADYMNGEVQSKVPRLFALLPVKNADKGEFYGYSSRQSQETAAGLVLKKIADCLERQRNERNQDAKQAQRKAEKEAAEQEAITAANEAAEQQQEAAEQQQEAAEQQQEAAEQQQEAADLTTLELLELLKIRLPSKVGTIDKWIKEL